MFNGSEKEERVFLQKILERLRYTLRKIDGTISEHSKDVQDFKEYLWNNMSDMDHAEKVSVRQSITQTAMTGESALERKKRIRKLIDIPYFGRIDFAEEDQKQPWPIYIGIHSFYDFETRENLIHDWRAPISGMFYDYELGPAVFKVPDGEVEGEISLKRQYRIRKSTMEFMLESSLNIHDDVLQKELSATSDEKMKNIVATIQREQNAIIRDEDAFVLIIQGVAGSGKTSIALHRIAYLLYRFKDTISSDNILIISPNKVFGDYIANVLPELGEEKILETGMEDIAREQLNNKYKFQTFFEQVSDLVHKKDEAFSERIRFKATFEFLNLLKKYLLHIENHYFEANDVKVDRFFIPAGYAEERFRAWSRVPLAKRFQRVAKDIVGRVEIMQKTDIPKSEIKKTETQVKKMFRITNLQSLYKDFYDWLQRPDMFKKRKGGLEFADVFPMVYLKIMFEGPQSASKIKHLLVDEMQDYTPVQYAVLSKLYPCRKTILGDANQSVNPFSSSKHEDISRVFPNAVTMKLNKSYRSTFEITSFAQNISPNDELDPIIRHGKEPQITGVKTAGNELGKISGLIEEFQQSSNQSLGIICKNQEQADSIHEQLKPHHNDVYLLNSESVAFVNGIVITTAHMAKGLEFDNVIVPHVNKKNYNNEVDKSMLYIACTRAMHQLNLTHCGELSELLRFPGN
ncbi:HelD family protein [Marinilabilia rubra]|uniref:Helicase n=1 Tax=Marinilabilia rubra TaxID=2162893 RepID=A0A2U2BBR4_9BACT|nr:UvrD-helicase domain-containing protein [Marinilabilia rubra]PWE00515.1 helicase [Marinilabilia rubra]